MHRRKLDASSSPCVAFVVFAFCSHLNVECIKHERRRKRERIETHRRPIVVLIWSNSEHLAFGERLPSTTQLATSIENEPHVFFFFFFSLQPFRFAIKYICVFAIYKTHWNAAIVGKRCRKMRRRRRRHRLRCAVVRLVHNSTKCTQLHRPIAQQSLLFFTFYVTDMIHTARNVHTVSRKGEVEEEDGDKKQTFQQQKRQMKNTHRHTEIFKRLFSITSDI